MNLKKGLSKKLNDVFELGSGATLSRPREEGYAIFDRNFGWGRVVCNHRVD